LARGHRGPGVDDGFGHAADQDFGLVVGRPRFVGVVVGENGDDDGTALGVDESDIVADVVQGADFVGDGRKVFGAVACGEVARHHAVVLLVAHHRDHLKAERAVVKIASIDALHDFRHLLRCSFAQAELLLIRRHGTLRRLEYLFVEISVLEAHAREHFVGGAKSDGVDHHVRGGVVAEGDHQRDGVFERECETGVHQVEDARAADLIIFGENDRRREIQLSRLYLLERLQHESEFDDGGGLHRALRVKRNGFAGGQVLRIQRDITLVRRGEFFESLLEIRCIRQKRNRQNDGGNGDFSHRDAQTAKVTNLILRHYVVAEPMTHKDSRFLTGSASTARGPRLRQVA
jgi:hypothetical protein